MRRARLDSGKDRAQQQHTTPSRTTATFEAAPGERNRASIRMAVEQSGRQPHGSTTDEDMMGHPIDDHFDVQTTADQLAAARAELRNAKALADKLQTLLDSKTPQVEALHKEVENLGARLKAANNSARRWQDRAEDAERDRAEIAGVLVMHADTDFIAGDPSSEALARHIADKLITAPEPDIDTVPLADLLEAVGTYLEHDQAVTIRGSFEAVRHVQIHAIGLTFAVETHEASEALTKLQELAGCLVVEAAR